jgi:hypothetical protein
MRIEAMKLTALKAVMIFSMMETYMNENEESLKGFKVENDFQTAQNTSACKKS